MSSHSSRSISIRLIRDNEIEAVSAFTTRAYASTYEIDPSSGYYAELGRVAERAAQCEVWVAVDADSGELLGTVTTPRPGEHLSAFPQRGDMDFRLLAVAPSARGRGIGRALVQHCADLAVARGATRLVLHTGDDMDEAVALYERLGFERLTDIEENFPFAPGEHYAVRVYGQHLAST